MADPIHIGAPDGSVIEFPAGTSDDTIKSVMAKNFPPAAASASAAEPAAAEPNSTLQTVREAIHAPTRALENGALLGLGDRARAAIDSVLSGFSGYGQHLKDEQADTAQFAKDHPIASPALEATGGVIAPAAVVGAVGKGAALATKLGIGELGAKTLIGGGTGAGIGAVQGALASKDWTDPAQVAKDAAVSGLGGLVIGGVMPGAAKAVGAGYNAAANLVRGGVEGMSRKAAAPLLKAVELDGPAAVQARLAELGPDAMLADAGPTLFGTTQGAIGNSLEGRAIATRALDARDAATQARIQSDVDSALGPMPRGPDGQLLPADPQSVTDAIIAHRTAVDNVNYPTALRNASPVDTTDVLANLGQMIQGTPNSSMERRALQTLRDNLMTERSVPRLDPTTGVHMSDAQGNRLYDTVPTPETNANILHKVKGELDNVIEYDAPGLGVPAGAVKNQQAALKGMRYQLNNALETQVPGYANANAVSAALAKRAEAVQAGAGYLGSGKTTPSPERFATNFEPLEQGEKIAFAKGSRGEIQRILGTNPNDLVALKRELQGTVAPGEPGEGWNAAKIATVHGQDAANELIDTVNRNTKFRDTRTKAIEGAQTDLRNAARKEMKPDPSTETPLIGPTSTPTGIVTTTAKKALGTVVNALTKSDPTRSYGEVARALTEQGAARDQRLMAIVDALNRRQANAAGAETAGKVGSVVAALLGKSGADRLYISPNRRPQP